MGCSPTKQKTSEKNAQDVNPSMPCCDITKLGVITVRTRKQDYFQNHEALCG